MSDSNLSAKARDILERQRLLAARLKPQPRVVASVGASALVKPAPIRPVIDLTTADDDKDYSSVKRPATKNNVDPPQLKRPSKKRGLATNTSQAIIDAARAKAVFAAHPVSQPRTARAAASTAPIPRRSMAQQESGALAKLVMHVASSSTTVADDQAAMPTVNPDDFWKHLRDWDFVSQYAVQNKLQQNPQSDSSTAIFAKKPLPNVFLNPRHYTAAWAPLCMAECRAQLLQECMTNRSLANPIRVTCESTTSRARYHSGPKYDAPWMEENETGGHVLVRPKDPNAKNGLSFQSNDICVLIHPDYSTVLTDIGRGVARPPVSYHKTGSNNHDEEDDTHAYRSTALVGHTETPRNDWTGGGLVLKVSKRKWAVIGQKEMYLVKLGSNITALREFTALCRVDTLPLKHYLLGLHLEKEENRRKLSSRQSTDQILQLLGGSQALGTGFIDYCRGKFNASQLTAIAASANEYGEGGFTLIKGPPGTGS
jgi:hypothetical protein